MSRKNRPARDDRHASSGTAGRVSTSAPVVLPIDMVPDMAPIVPRDVDVPRVPRAGAHFIRRVYDAAGNLTS